MSGIDQARVLRFEVREIPAQWKELTAREKECLLLLVVHNQTRKGAAREMGVSESRVCGLIQTATRILRINNSIGDHAMRGIAFWMGRHWQEIEESLR